MPVQSRMSEELTALLCHGVDVRFLARIPHARPLHRVGGYSNVVHLVYSASTEQDVSWCIVI